MYYGVLFFYRLSTRSAKTINKMQRININLATFMFIHRLVKKKNINLATTYKQKPVNNKSTAF
jgi:hypothetical protein